MKPSIPNNCSFSNPISSHIYSAIVEWDYVFSSGSYLNHSLSVLKAFGCKLFCVGHTKIQIIHLKLFYIDFYSRMIRTACRYGLSPSLALWARSFSTNVVDHAQSGILPEGSLSAYFGTFKVKKEMLKDKETKNSLVGFIKLFDRVLKSSADESKSTVYGTVSFGKSLWSELTEKNEVLKKTGSELIDFPGYGMAPATQSDLYIHIHGKKYDVIYDTAQNAIKKLLNDQVLVLDEERMGFVYRDSRDLTGFIDGTENPHGNDERCQTAIARDASSYVMVQRYVHDIPSWEKLSVKDQEDIVGRTKPDSEELSPLPPRSHVARASVQTDSGESVPIVRHSLPYGTPGSEKGLWFTAYAHSLTNHILIQQSIFGLTKDKITDQLCTQFVLPITGSFFFTPSLPMIEML